MIFTGKGLPPKEVADEKDMLEKVADTPGGIGYIDSKNVDSRVKVVYKF